MWANNVEFYERERAACDAWSGGVCTSAPHNNLGLELMRRGDCRAAIVVLEEGLALPAEVNGGSEEVRSRRRYRVCPESRLSASRPLSNGRMGDADDGTAATTTFGLTLAHGLYWESHATPSTQRRDFNVCGWVGAHAQSMFLTLSACYATDGQYDHALAALDRAAATLPPDGAAAVKLAVNRASTAAQLCRLPEAHAALRVRATVASILPCVRCALG